MNPFAVCASCACYVKKTDPSCPFCGAAQRALVAARKSSAGRTSRAQWLAYGSTLAMVGCTSAGSAITSSPPDATSDGARSAAPAADSSPDEGTAPDATLLSADADAAATSDSPDVQTASAEATTPAADADSAINDDAPGIVDAPIWDEGPAIADSAIQDEGARVADSGSDGGAPGIEPTLLSGEGHFLCEGAHEPDAQVICDRAKEWCYTNHRFSPTSCVSLGTTCAPGATPDACAPAFIWKATACDGGLRRCDCVSVACGCSVPGCGYSGWCVDDEAGGVTVSCGQCYGAPPARLERHARRLAVS